MNAQEYSFYYLTRHFLWSNSMNEIAGREGVTELRVDLE